MDKEKRKEVDKEKIKQEIIDNFLEINRNFGKALMDRKLIADYDVDITLENFKIAKDGVPEYELYISHKITPIRSLKYIDVDFTIMPTGAEFKD